ncbi:MAG: outer membrane beta-barrel protein [Bacteroidaceae bacterium]|nr:outer membrane beta-barrel protein [Bacteroidaceae bacterium]
MKRSFLLLTIFSLLIPSLCAAQKDKEKSKLDGKVSVNAHIIDGSTTENMPQVTVQLFELPDTTFIYGTVTDNEGWFNIKKVPVGEFLLRYSFMGYSTQEFSFKTVKEDRERALGVFKLYEKSIMLTEAVIEEALPPTQVVDDTLMFNVSAFRVPEGSVLEELIKRLPGVEVDENGGITVNGRTVSRILVDGQEYFGNDQQMATKNLPVNIIRRIKTYQRQSDLARITGIDDGEEETVMDLEIKPNMRNGWLNNIDGAIGKPVGKNDYGEWVKYLYSGRYTLNRFQANTQFSVNANTQNSGRGNGVSYNHQLGVNFSKNIGEPYPRRRNEFPLVIGGNVRYNGSDSRSLSESESETFTTQYQSASFRNNRSNSSSGNGSVNGEFRMEWMPDSSLNIIFRPSFQISRNHSNSNSDQVTFNTDPYIATDMVNILDEYRYLDVGMMDSIGVNSQKSYSYSKTGNNQVSGEFQFNKRFNDLGRNFTVRFTFSSTKGTNDSYSFSDQRYYQDHRRDSVMNRYNVSPTDNSSWSGRIMWSEPIDSGRGNLQLSYQIQVNNRNQNRETYVLWGDEFEDWYETWGLPDDLKPYRNDRLSRSATNVSRNHTLTLQFRYNLNNSNFNIGVNFMPQYTGMDNFQYMGKIIGDTSRVVYNWSPSLNYRYRFDRQKSIQVTFRTNTSQPSMEDMMDITDDSNPLNIRKGNPGLLPTLRNTAEANYQNYITETQKTINLRVSLENSLRNVTQKTDYDPSTGVSVTQPINMEGFWTNWSASTNLTYNQTIPNTKWRYNASANGSYRHQESYMRTGSIGQYNPGAGTGGTAVLSSTNTISAGENASVTYRNQWLEVTANGRFTYNHSENNQRQNQNMDTYTFSYGGRANARLPWRNLNLGTDITMQSRRGYSGSYNRNDLIWNANASFSFLKGNAGTIQIQYYDILNDETNVTRSVSTTGRTDTKNNNIHSYIMVHFILRVNVFGTRAARQEMRQENRAMMGRGGGFGGPGGGMPRGGRGM